MKLSAPACCAALLVAACNQSPPPGETHDSPAARRGTIEVEARLEEIPPGAIFERDLYHYAAVLKYEVVRPLRGNLRPGETIYVAHYDPWKPRDRAPDKAVPNTGGTLDRFEAGAIHRMALDAPLDDFYMGGIVDKYFGQRADTTYWAAWTDPAD